MSSSPRVMQVPDPHGHLGSKSKSAREIPGNFPSCNAYATYIIYIPPSKPRQHVQGLSLPDIICKIIDSMPRVRRCVVMSLTQFPKSVSMCCLTTINMVLCTCI